MSPGPSRTTIAGRRYRDLQNLARRTGRPTDELHQLYALEGFLERLAHSPHGERFVLKGGVLLAAYDSRRPTRDIDLAGIRQANDADEIKTRVCEIATLHTDDGLAFDIGNARAEMIRDENIYTGVRVGLSARLATARLTFHVDVNVGDPLWPSPIVIAVPRILGGAVEVLGYPLAMVHAEKLVTALQRGIANTRWRDFVDIASLARTQPIDAADLARSVAEVSRFRQVAVGPLEPMLVGYDAVAQQRWAAWRRRQLLADRT
ncbi:MAG TPA: nucleotidyl transferase AbiEii/AbiGii toxin family protein, partial [Acidimicrobiales bacterium]